MSQAINEGVVETLPNQLLTEVRAKMAANPEGYRSRALDRFYRANRAVINEEFVANGMDYARASR